MLCDGFLRADEPYLERGEERICPDCIKEMEITDLLLLLGLADTAELITLCSAWRKSF